MSIEGIEELKTEIEKNQKKIKLLNKSINTGKSTPAERRVWVGCKCYIQGVKQTIESVDKMEAENTTLLINDNASKYDYDLWEELKELLKGVR